MIKYFSLDEDIISKIEGTEYVCPERWKKSEVKHLKSRIKSKGKGEK